MLSLLCTFSLPKRFVFDLLIRPFFCFVFSYLYCPSFLFRFSQFGPDHRITILSKLFSLYPFSSSFFLFLLLLLLTTKIQLFFPVTVLYLAAFYIVFEPILNAFAECFLFPFPPLFPFSLIPIFNSYLLWRQRILSRLVEQVLSSPFKLSSFLLLIFSYSSTTWDEFARKWNKQVHVWAMCHCYLPLIQRRKLSKTTAGILTFFISSVMHEFALFMVFRFLRPWMFILQV